MAQFKQWFEQDFTEKIEIRHCESVMFTGDDQGTIVGVHLYDNGTPYSSGGTVMGYVKRIDGCVVVITGALSGNAASIVLPAAALAYAGPIGVQITLTQGGQVTTVLKVIYSVDDISGIPVDPGEIIPSLPELIAAAEAAISEIQTTGQAVLDSIPSDYTSLSNDITGLDNALKQTIDFTTKQINHYAIDTSNQNKWVYYSTLGTYVIPVSGAKTVYFKGNTARNGMYAFLRTGSIAAGEVADFSAVVSGVQSIPKNEDTYVQIPSDCNYLYVYCYAAGPVDYMPQIVALYTNVYAASEQYNYPESEKTNYVIDSGNGNKWAYYSALETYIHDIKGVDEITIEASSSRPAMIAFLKSANIQSGVAADFSSIVSGVQTITANNRAVFNRPDDANYLYVYAFDFNRNDYRPKSVILTTTTTQQISSLQEEVDALKSQAAAKEYTPCIFDIADPVAPSVGFSGRVVTDKFITCEDINICVNVTLGTASSVVFLGSVDTLNQDHASHVQFDFGTKQMRFYARGAGTSQPTTVVHTESITSVVSGTKYRLYIGCKNRELYAKVENGTTGDSVSYSVPATAADDYVNPCGWLQDKLVYGIISGSATFERITAVTRFKPFIAFVGDSITMGAFVPFESSWPYLVATELGKDCLALGRGGATVQMCLQIIKDITSKICPVYTVITAGTNGGYTQENYQAIIDAVKKSGSVPILNHVTMMSSASDTAAINTVIDGMNQLGALFDNATAIGNNPASGQNTSMFVSDHLHPNEAGHLAMANRFLADMGWISL